MAKKGEDCQVLREQKKKAILLFASGKTVAAIATEVGVSERSLYRWLKQPGFASRISALQLQDLRRGASHLSRATPRAVIALRKLLKSKNEKIRLQAAAEILKVSLRLKEQLDFGDRLAALEHGKKGDGDETKIQTVGGSGSGSSCQGKKARV